MLEIVVLMWLNDILIDLRAWLNKLSEKVHDRLAKLVAAKDEAEIEAGKIDYEVGEEPIKRSSSDRRIHERRLEDERRRGTARVVKQ